MKIEHAESFDKSVKKIKDVIALKRLKVFIVKLKEAASLKEISNVIPMVNNPFLYRIRENIANLSPRRDSNPGPND